MTQTKIDINTILKETLVWHHIGSTEWFAIRDTRKLSSVRVKQVVSLIAHECGYSHGEIASFFGHHRTTVIHHIKGIKDDCKIYIGIRNMVDAIRESIREIPLPCEQKTYTTTAWLARSRSGVLTISPMIPEDFNGYYIAVGSKPLHPQDSFPQITYEKGPVKVNVEVTIDENETM